MTFSDTYRGKKVFVTGHTGFKGSWFIYWLNMLGAKVMGYALAPLTSSDLYYALNGDSLCTSVIGDIRDKEKLAKAVHDFQPDFIFHLAAQPLVRASYDEPIYTFETNVLGTAYLLEAVAGLQGRCTVVVITTDKVYENKEWLYPYRENDRLGGLDPYSSSKACCELVTHSYMHSFFPLNKFDTHLKSIATARAGNVIGGGDWAKDRIIPDIVNACKANKRIPVRNPGAVRPWQHVLEPLSGYLMLGARLSEQPEFFTGAWNFGPLADDNLTVMELVKKAIEIWGDGEYDLVSRQDQPHEAGLLKLDISKALAQLNWRPKWNASQAIETTLNWYKSNAKEDAGKLVRQDIENYVKTV